MKLPHATVQWAGDDLLLGTSPSGHAQVLDFRGERSVGPSPTELLLLAVGACSAADVISILEKKRQQVTAYRVEIKAERREELPRSYQKFELRHVVRGHGISETAVRRAIELSENKYCGVAATVRPTAEVVSSFVIEEEA